MPRMRTIKEAAAETGLKYSCIRKWCLTGEFNGYVKAGTKYLINMELFADFLTGRYKEEKSNA